MTLLERNWFTAYSHKDCFGRIVALYIYSKKKWVKIGEYCRRCSEIGLLPEYVNGFDKK